MRQCPGFRKRSLDHPLVSVHYIIHNIYILYIYIFILTYTSCKEVMCHIKLEMLELNKGVQECN